MAKENDFNHPHICPVYGRELEPDLCYETLMAMKKMVKISSVPEVGEIKDIETARQQCQNCEYSEL